MAHTHPPLQFSVPVHWDFSILEQVYELREQAEQRQGKGIEATMYGALPDGSFGSGRIHGSLPAVPASDAQRYVRRAQQLGFRFRYLFNPRNILTKSTAADITGSLRMVVEGFGVDGVTVSQRDVLALVQEKHPHIAVTISTIAGVQTPEEIDRYARYRSVERICAHHDLNRNIPLLRKCIAKAKETGIGLELMLTENCVDRCPIRNQHYAVLGRDTSQGKKVDDYQVPCWLDKLRHPEEIIAASWITPEGIDFYRSLGIHEFKITGRDKDPRRLPLAVEAYFNLSFDGNLMRLLGTAPQAVTGKPVEAEDLAFLDTSALQGFYERLDDAFCSGIPYRDFCRSETERLFKEGSFRLLDGHARYALKDGRVTATRLGDFYRQMMDHAGKTRVYGLWKNARGQEE
ncbi:MAG TPA: hypothetical protein VJC16_00965 [Candidatus Nanoarchaeia archaeon]|nr:hypothetical protein [Candidatus Nanoarchaeia archaeon]